MVKVLIHLLSVQLIVQHATFVRRVKKVMFLELIEVKRVSIVKKDKSQKQVLLHVQIVQLANTHLVKVVLLANLGVRAPSESDANLARLVGLEQRTTLI